MGSDAALEKLLPREPLAFDLPDVKGKHVMVTGSSGFIGSRVCRKLLQLGANVDDFDLPNGDILKPHKLKRRCGADAIIHFAAHKQAPEAERYPGRVAELNIVGTANVVKLGCPVILASTCKAADPSTVYGASKLIAEREVLNAGGTVIRYVNVLGSSGSVIQLWEEQKEHEVTECLRMWMSPREAVELAVVALGLPPGRYIPDVGDPEPILNLYRRCHSQPIGKFAPLRRGDRRAEKLVGVADKIVGHGSGWLRVEDAWGT